ncbi:hypothetical protein ABW21_db0201978 [Orbilia brochopaga]|nr:hypothetical protein ABW21_db0201978 [Drechslerella brochopaga]
MEDKPTPPLIDSHVHLFRPSDIPTFNWSEPKFPIHHACDFHDYITAISPIPAGFAGFVFIETDRKYQNPASPSTDDELVAWRWVLEEYRYVLQTAHSPSLQPAERNLVRGIVPWAPVHQGRDAMVRYQSQLDAVEAEVGVDSAGRNKLLVGYRWLLQDAPAGTASQPAFIEGLEYIRNVGRIFEVGVDVNRQGLGQLEEAVTALKKVPGLKVVVNHLGKPPMGREPNGGWRHWEALMGELAALPDAVVKLSGCFSELPDGYRSFDGAFPRDQVMEMAIVYAREIFKLFGPQRIIWASDWPVCGIGRGRVVGKQEGAWHDWFAISKALVAQLREEGEIEGAAEEWDAIWGTNSVRVYSLINRIP